MLEEGSYATFDWQFIYLYTQTGQRFAENPFVLLTRRPLRRREALELASVRFGWARLRPDLVPSFADCGNAMDEIPHIPAENAAPVHHKKGRP